VSAQATLQLLVISRSFSERLLVMPMPASVCPVPRGSLSGRQSSGAPTRTRATLAVRAMRRRMRRRRRTMRRRTMRVRRALRTRLLLVMPDQIPTRRRRQTREFVALRRRREAEADRLPGGSSGPKVRFSFLLLLLTLTCFCVLLLSFCFLFWATFSRVVLTFLLLQRGKTVAHFHFPRTLWTPMRSYLV